MSETKRYTVMYDEGERVKCCNCGYPAPVASIEVQPSPTLGHAMAKAIAEGESRIWLCEVCSSTGLAAATTHPSLCKDVFLYQAVGWIANRILFPDLRHTIVDELKEARKAK